MRLRPWCALCACGAWLIYLDLTHGGARLFSPDPPRPSCLSLFFFVLRVNNGTGAPRVPACHERREARPSGCPLPHRPLATFTSVPLPRCSEPSVGSRPHVAHHPVPASAFVVYQFLQPPPRLRCTRPPACRY